MIDLQSQLEGLSAYESNVQDGISWENTASSAMSNMNDIAQRVRELVVQAANGTNNQSDLNTIALEVEQLTESIKQDANTQYAGQYVFSGTATTTAPYVQGAERRIQGQRRNRQPRGRAGRDGDDQHQHLDAARQRRSRRRRQAARHAAHDRPAPARRHRRRHAKRSARPTCTNLDRNLETLSQLQAVAGSATDQLQAALTRNEDLQTSITEALSNTEDTNIAASSIAYANEQAAYEAALRAGATIVQESLLNFLQ